MKTALLRGIRNGLIAWLFVAAYLLPFGISISSNNMWHFTTL